MKKKCSYTKGQSHEGKNSQTRTVQVDGGEGESAKEVAAIRTGNLKRKGEDEQEKIRGSLYLSSYG